MKKGDKVKIKKGADMSSIDEDLRPRMLRAKFEVVYVRRNYCKLKHAKPDLNGWSLDKDELIVLKG